MTFEHSTGFTPVRRKEDTINNGRFEAEQEQEWTTARCHRLLRSLTSRVAALNKEISRFSSTHTDQQKTSAAPRRFPLSKTRTPDDDWAVQPKKKKLKRTYGGRGRTVECDPAKPTTKSIQRDGPAQNAPGELAVPTPMLARARGVCGSHNVPIETGDLNVVSPSSVGYRCKLKRPNCSAYSWRSTWQLTTSISDLKRTVESHKLSAYEGVYAGLETLMRNTAVDQPATKSRGVRSLFAMALRSVPAVIFEQEYLLDSHMDETSSKSAIIVRDMSTEIYDDLESLGSSGKHWKHLRTVVRSHGIHIVANAIEDSLLDADISGTLISMLVSTQAYEEAEILLQALLHRQTFAHPKTLNESLDDRLSMLIKYSRHTKRFAFLYSQLVRLFTEGTVSASWLATRAFSEVWIALVVHISADEAVALPAREFLQTAMPLLGTDEDAVQTNISSSVFNLAVGDAMRNTLTGLLTTISAMFILSSEARSLDTFDIMTVEGYEQLEYVLDSTILSTKSMHGNTVPLLLLSQILMKDFKYPRDPVDHREQRKRLDQRLRMTNVLQESATFLSNLARCCGKGAYSSGFEYLQQLHYSVVDAEEEDLQSNMLGCIVVDSAYDFAQRYPCKEHLEYASQMDLKLARRTTVPVEQTPRAKSKLNDGFRWEEGIGEWVTATPALHLVKRTMTMTLDSCSNAGYETPFMQRAKHIPQSASIPSSPLISRAVFVEIPSMTFDSSPIRRSIGTVSDTEDDTSRSENDTQEMTDVTDVSDVSDVSDHETAVKTSRRGLRNSSCDQLQLSSSISKNGTQIKVVIDHSPDLIQAVNKSATVCSLDEDSDDELSFISVSSQASQTLSKSAGKVANELGSSRSLRPRHKAVVNKPGLRPRKRPYVDLFSDSEDELCI